MQTFKVLVITSFLGSTYAYAQSPSEGADDVAAASAGADSPDASGQPDAGAADSARVTESPAEPVSAQAERTAPEETVDASLAALGVGQYGRRNDSFVLWENQSGGYIKPILWVSGSLLAYLPDRPGNEDYASRPATLLVSRFGFEGALTDWASFKFELQRDLGFSLASNGPQGTGIFEGTASLQAREMYVSLHKWGATVTAGIQTDPASVDFITPHVLGMFGMDPFTRDYLLNSGFNLGQGVMLRYQVPGLDQLGAGRLVFGFQFTSGNPLTTSLSYAFGGNVTQTGTLFSGPLRSLVNGTPGTNILLTTYNPSLTYEVDIAPRIGFDLRASAQIYVADVDTTSAADANLEGTNFRGTARLRLPYVNLMGGFSRRVNQQLALPDLSTRLGDKFEATVWSLGAEANYGRYGIGAHYASVRQELFNNAFNHAKYFNVGASYQLVPGYLQTQLRYASVQYDFENIPAVPTNAKMISLSLALTI